MITVAIMGILLSIMIPKFTDLIRRGNEGATKGNLGAIRSAINIYYGEAEGWYPASDPGPILTMDGGKYLKEVPDCYCPPYHAKVSMFDISGTTETTNAGCWSYQSNITAAGPPAPGVMFGSTAHIPIQKVLPGQVTNAGHIS